jgi:hypothetical protein
LAHVFAEELCHLTGGGAGGEAAGFEDDDAAVIAPGGSKQSEGYARGLAGAGLGHEHGAKTHGKGIGQGRQGGVDGQRRQVHKQGFLYPLLTRALLITQAIAAAGTRRSIWVRHWEGSAQVVFIMNQQG